MPRQTTRRALLRSLAAMPVVTAGIGALPGALRAQAEGEGLIAGNVCMVTPETTAGPFYLNPHLVRADIREDRAGLPLDLALQVVTPDCAPIEGARVDVWHCDARGNYSGYAGQGSDAVNDTTGQTFLRGTQRTGPDGTARFVTIYPGWYRGRTTHIHYKVYLDDRSVLTSQVFFPDAVSERVYADHPPYNERMAIRQTLNQHDRIAQRAGDGAFAEIREMAEGYDAALVVGVDV